MKNGIQKVKTGSGFAGANVDWSWGIEIPHKYVVDAMGVSDLR